MRLLALVLGLTTGLKPQPTRQELLRGAAASALLAPVPPARAEEFKDVATVRTTAQALGVDEKDLPQKNQDVKLRTYVDPLFDLTFPKDWFAIRRTIDGDIVRRGGVIFSAGNLRTAEVVTVELFKVKELLEQAEALPYFPEGKIKQWNDLGRDRCAHQLSRRVSARGRIVTRTPSTRRLLDVDSRAGKDAALAQFVCERRDGEATASARKQQIQARASTAVPGSLSVRGDVLQLDIATDIQGTTARVGEAGSEVMTPGIRRLQRARLTLLPGGSEVMGVVAGCLDDLWSSGEDRVLGDVVESFRIKAVGAAPLLPA